MGGLSQARQNIHTHTPPCPQPSVSFHHTIGPCLRAPSEQLWQWGMRQPRQAGTEWVVAGHTSPSGLPGIACKHKGETEGHEPTGTALINGLRDGNAPLGAGGPRGLPYYGQCPLLASFLLTSDSWSVLFIYVCRLCPSGLIEQFLEVVWVVTTKVLLACGG